MTRWLANFLLLTHFSLHHPHHRGVRRATASGKLTKTLNPSFLSHHLSIILIAPITMSNSVDHDLQTAEVDADPRHQSSQRGGEKPRTSAEAVRPSTSGSVSSMSSSGSSSSVEYNANFHRLQSRNTELDLERRRSGLSQALSRIETQRLQHSMTVGESVKSRPSKLPLPAFGAGKPYPPLLPSREDYVVEFDGPDDPLYPQNWSLQTK